MATASRKSSVTWAEAGTPEVKVLVVPDDGDVEGDGQEEDEQQERGDDGSPRHPT